MWKSKKLRVQGNGYNGNVKRELEWFGGEFSEYVVGDIIVMEIVKRERGKRGKGGCVRFIGA